MATIEDYEYLKNKSPELYSELQKYFEESEKQERIKQNIKNELEELSKSLKILNDGYQEMADEIFDLKNDKDNLKRRFS